MRRAITQLAPRVGRVALRPHVVLDTPAAATSQRLRHAVCLTPSSGTSAGLFAVCAVAPRRWCSSKVSPPSPAAGGAGAASLAPCSPPAETAPTDIPSVAEQISGLSAEDQQRILAALQNPEKEKSSVMGGGGIGPATADMVAAFTCGPCDFRMVKRFSKHAYTKGIVIVECPNCRAKHLLADNLGWLEDEARNIEDILREKGEHFTRIGDSAGDFQVVAAADEEKPTETKPAADTPKQG